MSSSDTVVKDNSALLENIETILGKNEALLPSKLPENLNESLDFSEETNIFDYYYGVPEGG